MRAAVLRNDTPGVIALLKQGADPNAHPTERHSLWKMTIYAVRQITSRRHETGDTPLMLALRPRGQSFPYADTALIEALLAADADANVKVLARQSDIFNHRRCYDTPLLFAVMARARQVSFLLVQHGADVNVPTLQSPLARAISNQDNITVRMLLRAGADVNAQDSLGDVPLSYAAFSGNIEATQMLLAKHANPRLKDINGADVVAYAETNGNQEIARMLRKSRGVPIAPAAKRK